MTTQRKVTIKTKVIPLILISIGLLLTCIAARQIYFDEKSDQQNELRTKLQNYANQIETELVSYEVLLVGSKGFFESSDTVTRQEFGTFFEDTIDNETKFTPLSMVSYLDYAANEQRANAIIDSIRAEKKFDTIDLSAIELRPNYTPNGAFIVKYREPFVSDEFIGFNTATLPGRADTYFRSFETNNIASFDNAPLLSGGVGFTLAQAIENKDGSLAGVTLAVVESNQFLTELFKKNSFKNVSFNVYSPSANKLLYRAGAKSETPDITARQTYTFDKTVFRLTASSQFSPSIGFYQTILFGVLLSLLLGYLVFLLSHSRDKALKLARQLSKDVREKQEFLSGILDGTEYSVIATKVDGTITHFNKGAEKMLGYNASEVLQKNTPALFHLPEEVRLHANNLTKELGHAVEPGFDAFVAKTKEQGVPDRNEWTYVAKDGTTIPVSLSVTTLEDASDNLIGFLGIAVDISKEKELEQTKADFLNIASHQLQTPATAVKQYIAAILQGYMGSINKEVEENLGYAYESNERQIRIVNDMLNVARIESGTLRLTMEKTNIVEVVQLALKEISTVTAARNQQYKVDLPQKFDATVDPRLFRMVVDNLISNASKYTPDGGSFEVKLTSQDGSWSLAVTDNGVGIDELEQNKLFKRFGRIDNELSETRGGTGLGLYIVKQIIELHNGTIDVTSSKNEGTSFTINM